VTRAIERLQQRGWTVKNLVDPNAKYQRFAADDATRLAQIYQAAEDKEVDIILALRGGYGLSRLLDQIDFARLAATQKRFVGFSDFTAFQLGLLAKTGTISFAGPMVNEDFGGEELHAFSFDHFKQCLTQRDYHFNVAVDGNPTLQVQGTFWGGNLSILAHLVGTPFLPNIVGGILFIEDVNENPYRIERMILQLHHAGILAQQKALVLGHFTNYTSSEYDNGYDFDVMLSFLRRKLSIPVITGLPFGHCPNKVTLPIGAQVLLNSDNHHLSLQFANYPYLAKKI
jgi:muramoyltetrapeptide carboxypeptidase